MSENVGEPDSTNGPSENLPVGSGNFDEDDWSDVEPKTSTLRNLGKFVGIAVLICALVFGAFFLGQAYSKSKDATPTSNSSQDVTASDALTQTQLRDLVISKKLTAYWAGPLPGYKYAIFVPKANVVVIRYLPDGNGLKDTAPNYRVIGTYIQKGATEAVVSSGKKEGSVGFTNIDGNAVFYVRSRPTNVYMAIKGKDIQIEIFDPGQDQAVALSLFKGQIVQIK